MKAANAFLVLALLRPPQGVRPCCSLARPDKLHAWRALAIILLVDNLHDLRDVGIHVYYICPVGVVAGVANGTMRCGMVPFPWRASLG